MTLRRTFPNFYTALTVKRLHGLRQPNELYTQDCAIYYQIYNVRILVYPSVRHQSARISIPHGQKPFLGPRRSRPLKL